MRPREVRLREVRLREVRESDLPLFHAMAQDAEAQRLAAFTAEDPADRTRFDAHWARILTSAEVMARTVLADGAVVGHAAVYGPPDEREVREVTYWIDRDRWGHGIATAALRALLAAEPARPLSARAAADNAGSIRVLEKCGFTVTGRSRAYAPGRGEETDEVLLTLER
ncbi:GNAT family N-acetyltransferase [Streptomyces sp. NPDC002018]|uniref:GNAT family N-acetyltransferase n=1 Tax=Streptomyces sp. NPDC002018 TaxID=3364629 RepID=UPI0036AA1DC3